MDSSVSAKRGGSRVVQESGESISHPGSRRLSASNLAADRLGGARILIGNSASPASLMLTFGDLQRA